MRRRRSRMKTFARLRLFAQGRTLVFLLVALFCAFVQCEPGYLDFDNLPETNFTCAGKVIGGYYADLETSCQMFHVCTIGQLDEPMDIKFLCLNGTVFDQETRVCERVDEVDCSRSERFYYLNLELYGNTMVPISEDDDDSSDDSDGYSHPHSSSSTSTTPAPPPPTTSTTTTTTTTTTRRPTPPPTTSSSTTTTQRPAHTIAVKPLPPRKQPVVSSTVKPIHYVTTFKTYDDRQHPDDGDEYEYEDDYAATDGKELGSFHDTSNGGNHDGLAEQVFSPQQFIFNQNSQQQQHAAAGQKGSGGLHGAGVSPKPAISFQQQQFQNGGSLTVTNSHVTVTTHTAGNQNQNHNNNNDQHHHHHANNPANSGKQSSSSAPSGNKQFSSRPKQTAALAAAVAAAAAAGHGGSGHGGTGPSTAEEDRDIISGSYAASTRKPDYAYGAPPPIVSKLPVFRLPAHGFRLPSPEQAEAVVAAQNKHAADLKRHQEEIDQQLRQQHDHSPQEQHLRELEQHQRRLEQLQQLELGKQLREQEQNRRDQERRRQEQERERQQQQQTQSSVFEGYQRQNPQFGSQISLRLPLEHNPNQPQFLALAQADSDFPQREHKDTKRSDPHATSGSGGGGGGQQQQAANKRSSSVTSSNSGSTAHHSSSPYPTHANEYRESISSSSSRKSHQIVSVADLNKAAATTTTSKTTTTTTRATTSTSTATSTASNGRHKTPTTATTTTTTTTHQPNRSASRSTATPHNRHFDHRVLLTPQDQYIPTLPKVIITASASVSDANGKKLNYSLGNAIGPNVKIPPPTYDEYRDDDVVLDPFYLDVPKIRPHRRSTRRASLAAWGAIVQHRRSDAVATAEASSAQLVPRRRMSGFAKKKRKK